ncbi:MAG: tetratricopeptide repeat protein [Thermodesulfobacteriota bacterium]
MGAVTYPNETVIEFINQNVIPLRVTADHPLATEFNIKWTPSLLILDQEGHEHHRTVGFMSPEELIPSLLLGIGNSFFNGNDFNKALSCYEKIMADYSGSDSAPEAIFQKGVSLYKSTNDPKPLKEAYEYLQDKYPASQWTRRAYPYRLIE